MVSNVGERKKTQFNHLLILPEAGHYGGQVLPDHVAVHVEDLLGQEEKLIMALRVLETLKILPGSLSEWRVVSHAILDGRVDPAGLSVEVVGGVGGGGGVSSGGRAPGAHCLHHDEPPATLWGITSPHFTSLHFLFYFDNQNFLVYSQVRRWYL